MKTHHDLDVWKRAIDLVILVYKSTQQFPKEELYGLTSQIRRSAVSIPSNIAEGAGRASTKEFIRFLSIAVGSIVELETQLIISKRLGYLSIPESDSILEELSNIRRMTLGLKKSLAQK